MADIEKYSSMQVDRKKYLKFRQACENKKVTMISVMNMMMEEFVEENA